MLTFDEAREALRAYSDPIVRALTPAMVHPASNVRYGPDWQSARLDPQ